MKNFPDFFFWIIIGGIYALFLVAYDIYLSTKGKDGVSEIRKLYGTINE